MEKIERFRTNVISKVVIVLGGGLAAEELLLGTAIQESLYLKYRVQMGGGPARGLFQMEPETHNDIWNNYLNYRPELKRKLREFKLIDVECLSKLQDNDFYAASMARIHYLRVSEALPDKGDVEGQARYWKKYYNTKLGKGTEKEYIEKWENICKRGKNE